MHLFVSSPVRNRHACQCCAKSMAGWAQIALANSTSGRRLLVRTMFAAKAGLLLHLRPEVSNDLKSGWYLNGNCRRRRRACSHEKFEDVPAVAESIRYTISASAQAFVGFLGFRV